MELAFLEENTKKKLGAGPDLHICCVDQMFGLNCCKVKLLYHSLWWFPGGQLITWR